MTSPETILKTDEVEICADPRTEELSRCDLQIASLENEIELLRQNKPHSYELQPLQTK
jgi:hypothetical protein